MKLKSIGALAIGILGIAATAAGATIVFTPPISEPPGIQEITNLTPFTITTDANGIFARNFVNRTGFRLIDWEFVTSTIQSSPIVGADMSGPPPAFLDTVGTTTSIHFVAGGSAVGIPTDTIVGIVMGGFTSQTTVTLAPSIPEPSTIVLVGGALAGIVVHRYSRRRKES